MPQSQPSELDEGLARRGYQVDAMTSLQTLDLRKTSFSTSLPDFSCNDILTDDWFSVFCDLSGTPEKHLAPMHRLLKLILPSHSFGLLQADGQPVACGLSVQQEGFIGLYDIVVAKEQRRKGYGHSLMEGLLVHGQRNGAKTAYLQVMLNNLPALQLYENLGFKEVYRYWYRVK